MIENFKSEIFDILQAAGEPVTVQDELICSRLGEGKGFVSDLWSVSLGGNKYAVKISDVSSKSGQIQTVYLQLHNRELQVYEWMKKYRSDERTSPYAEEDLARTVHFIGGTKCEADKTGIIIMADLSEHAISAEKTAAGLSLHTILSIIDGVAAYQSAYLTSEDEVEFVSKDLSFELLASLMTGLIAKTAERGWMKEGWKEALTLWSSIADQRATQYERKEGDLPHTLGHTDMWTNNILFSKNKNSAELELLAFVDWQAGSVCNPLIDLCSIIAINMNAKDRRAHERDILQHYIDAIKKKSPSFKKEFPVDTVDKLLPQYRQTLRYAALQLLMLLQREPVPKIDDVNGESSDSYSKEKLGIYTTRFIDLMEDIVD